VDQTRTIPIVPFSSFDASLDLFNELGGAPTEVHSSVFPKDRFSGTTIALLVKAYRQLGLAKDSGETDAEKVGLLVSPTTRKDAYRALLQAHYGSLIDIPISSATPNQFNKWFDEFNINADDTRKAKTFLLHAAKACDIAVSPYITKKYNTRSTKSSVSKPRSNGSSVTSPKPATRPAARKKDAKGEVKTVKLRGIPGSVSVHVDVAAMDILQMDKDGEEGELIYGLMSLLKKYEQQEGSDG
jgi:hypothetical protein